MTLSQIRNRINALCRKYARQLAVYRLRPLAEEISGQWAVDVASRKPSPDPRTLVRRIANLGFRFSTFGRLHQYLELCRNRGKIPEPCQIVLALLPCAGTGAYLHNLFRWDLSARS